MNLEERLKYATIKAKHAKVLRPWHKKWWGVSIIIISSLMFIFLVLASAYVVNRVQEILQGETGLNAEEKYQLYIKTIHGDGSNYFSGPADAQVTIVEFADFSCPFCRESAPGLRRIALEYQDQVKIIYRDYPLHENSIDLALAARCAGEQGRFWDIHDQIFMYKTETTATGTELRSMLMTLAAEMNLDTDRFNGCLEDNRYITRIKKDFDDGELLNIAGTPTFFINNHSVTGHIPEDRLRELIDGLLK